MIAVIVPVVIVKEISSNVAPVSAVTLIVVFGNIATEKIVPSKSALVIKEIETYPAPIESLEE